jgi:hypothetical protein
MMYDHYNTRHRLTAFTIGAAILVPLGLYAAHKNDEQEKARVQQEQTERAERAAAAAAKEAAEAPARAANKAKEQECGAKALEFKALMDRLPGDMLRTFIRDQNHLSQDAMDRLPADAASLRTLMFQRSLEACISSIYQDQYDTLSK